MMLAWVDISMSENRISRPRTCNDRILVLCWLQISASLYHSRENHLSISIIPPFTTLLAFLSDHVHGDIISGASFDVKTLTTISHHIHHLQSNDSVLRL